MLHPNDLDKFLTLESCQKIRVDDYVRQARNTLKKAIVEAQISVNGFNIKLTSSKTVFGGNRLWFKCPECGKRVGVLYQKPINSRLVCRKCLGLRYQKQQS